MSILWLLAPFLGGVLVSAATTGLVLLWLKRQRILDEPNHRSSHVIPTPRGGGLAVVPLVLLGWLATILLGGTGAWNFVIILGAGGLAALSWRDDRRGQPVLRRLGAQILAILVGLAVLPGHGDVFQGLLPPIADDAATVLVWVWFVNLYNFMDGIDGITGAETAVLGLGIAAVAALSGLAVIADTIPLGLTIAAAALGFLCWNWAPARVFLGDVGSVPLGYLLGWLLLRLAGQGLWAPALILPLYYLADATVTLVWRAVRLQPIWRPHREHFYQYAVQLGWGHAHVVRRILLANAGLVTLAMLALVWPLGSLLAAFPIVLGLLVWLRRAPQAPRG